MEGIHLYGPGKYADGLINGDWPMSDDRNWQAFSKIVEVMSFVDGIRDLDPQEIEERAQTLCELPPDPKHSMGVEEVIFWAGVATGMDVSRQAQEAVIDPGTADKLLVYSSLFAHSTKNAVVDLALQQMEISE
jgi:hypothetical protein